MFCTVKFENVLILLEKSTLLAICLSRFYENRMIIFVNDLIYHFFHIIKMSLFPFLRYSYISKSTNFYSLFMHCFSSRKINLLLFTESCFYFRKLKIVDDDIKMHVNRALGIDKLDSLGLMVSV